MNETAGLANMMVQVSPGDSVNSSQQFTFTGGVQTYTVPAGVTSIGITAWGAGGGNGNGIPGPCDSSFGNSGCGGTGFRLTGTFAVSAGQTLSVVVGGAGGSGAANAACSSGFGGSHTGGGGGGGGSFVYSFDTGYTLLIAAGGGGGGGSSGGPIPIPYGYAGGGPGGGVGSGSYAVVGPANPGAGGDGGSAGSPSSSRFGDGGSGVGGGSGGAGNGGPVANLFHGGNGGNSNLPPFGGGGGGGGMGAGTGYGPGGFGDGQDGFVGGSGGFGGNGGGSIGTFAVNFFGGAGYYGPGQCPNFELDGGYGGYGGGGDGGADSPDANAPKGFDGGGGGGGGGAGGGSGGGGGGLYGYYASPLTLGDYYGADDTCGGEVQDLTHLCLASPDGYYAYLATFVDYGLTCDTNGGFCSLGETGPGSYVLPTELLGAAGGAGGAGSSLVAGGGSGTPLLVGGYLVGGTAGGGPGQDGGVTITILGSATSTTVSSSANPSVFGQSVTFTATVSPVLSGGPTPTGTVTFMDGATTLGTGTLNDAAQATFTTAGLSLGWHSITAVYGGDANSPVSTSSTLAQAVAAPAPVNATIFACGTCPNPIAGQVFSSSGNFSDPNGQSWSATVDYGDGTGPQPLQLSNVNPGFTPTGQFSLSHTYAQPGTFTISVTITDGAGNVGMATLPVTVALPGGAPTITSSNNYGTYPIGEVDLPLSATGGTGNYTWSIVGGTAPPGLSISSNVPAWFAPGTTTGLIGLATTPGSYTFNVQVSDGIGTAVMPNVTIKITSLVVTTSYTLPDGFQGSPYSFQLSANGNAGPLAWTATGAMPAGLSLGTGGTISGTPTTSGFFNVPFTVTDGIDTIGFNLKFAIYAVQIATDGLLPYATINQPYNETIVAAGGSGGYTFQLGGGLPSGLTFNAGTFAGTPTQSGRWTFTITATDSSNESYSKNMSLVVVAVPAQLPQPQPYGLRFDDCAVGEQCDRAIGNWSAALPPFSWSASGLPPGMALRSGSGVTDSWVWPGDAELWGVPTTAGDYSVAMTVQDATGATATNTFPLHVSTIFSSSYPPSGTIGVPYSYGFRVIGGSGTYTGALTAGTVPPGLSFDGSMLTITGTPTAGGQFSPQFTFLDGSGNSFTYTTYVNIANAGNTSPIFLGLPNSATTQVGSANWGCGSFTDSNGGSWLATVNYGDNTGTQSLPLVMPPVGSCAPTSGPLPTGVFAFNHAYSSSGSFTVSVTVTNTVTLASKTSGFTVTVNLAPIFLSLPNSVTTQVNSANWGGCGSFTDSNGGAWTVSVNYGDGTVTPSLPLTLSPAPGSPCVPTNGTPPTGVFSFNHAYSAPGPFSVGVTVTNTITLASKTSGFTVTVNLAPIFLGLPNSVMTQVGSANWGCGSFTDQNGGSWSATVNYGDNTGPQSLPLTIAPAPGSPCVPSSGPSPTGVFAFNHAYTLANTYTVMVTVTDHAGVFASGQFPVTVSSGNGGGGDQGCAQLTLTFMVGGVPFTDAINIAGTSPQGSFDPQPITNIFTESSPGVYVATIDNPGSYHVGFTLPNDAGDSVSPSAIDFTVASCGANLQFSLGIAAPNRVPLVSVVSPLSVPPGGSDFPVTVEGTGFVNGQSTIDWNGSALPTTCATSPAPQLAACRATVPAADVALATTANITVVTPAPGGGRSNVMSVAVTTPTSTLAFAGATGSPVSVLSSPYVVYLMGTGDFNGDGKPDLAVVSYNYGTNGDGPRNSYVSVLLSNGDGTFQAPVSYAVGTYAISVAVGDFNGDGNLDLAVTNDFDGTVSILLGLGNGTFQAAGTYPAASGADYVAVGDFNGDGNLDLAVTNVYGNNVSILLGSGNGTFQSPVNYAVGADPDWVAVGDFNGDGRLDLVVGNSGSSNVSVLLGNGDGTFQPAVNSSAGDGPFPGAVGDFNGDGKLDVAVPNAASATVSVLLGVGDGTFQPPVSYAVGSNPQAVATADVNGDGVLDLVVANAGSNTVGVLLGNDDGTFQAALNFPVGSQPESVVVADFNGDGRPDFATSNGAPNTDTVSVLLQTPVAGVVPTSLSFSAQNIGTTSAAQPVTLSNTGSATLAIASLAASGDFAQTNTCGSTLATGGTCTISVTFTPTASGVRSGAITITDNAGGSPQTVSLTGPGTAPATVTLGNLTQTYTGSPLTPTVTTVPSGLSDTLSGAPDTNAGSYPVTATVTDPNYQGSASGTFTITAATATVTLGNLTQTYTGSPLTPTVTTVPPGLSYTLSGEPDTNAGSYPVTATVTDPNYQGSASGTFTISMATQPPAFTSAAATTFTVGAPGSFIVTATGYPAPKLQRKGKLPAGVTFDAATGILSGTPAAKKGGTYPLTFTAKNAAGTATQSFTLTVNEAPAITSAATATFTVGTAESFTITTTGFPAPTLGELGALPAGVTFDPATGFLSGTPAVGAGGTYSVTITASNGVGPDASQTFTLTVREGPTVTSAAATTFTVGVAGSFTVTATGYPAPTLSRSGALPAGVTFDAATGILSGTPAAKKGGTYPLTFTAKNAAGTTTQSFTLTVN